jgi:outer membrane lipoprotein carrier protein
MNAPERRGISAAALILVLLASPSSLAVAPLAGKPAPRASKAAPAAEKHEPLPQILQDLETKYSRAATLMAEFKQVNTSAAMGNTKISSGYVLFKRPDKIRWETIRPDKNLMISDGKRFWFYTPPFDETENGQVIERKSSEIKSKLANDLLSATFSAAVKVNGLKITQEAPSTFLLVPRKGSAGSVAQARIEVDTGNKLITKVFLSHKGGNTSEITLSKIELGKDLADHQFIFELPPKTDRVTH